MPIIGSANQNAEMNELKRHFIKQKENLIKNQEEELNNLEDGFKRKIGEKKMSREIQIESLESEKEKQLAAIEDRVDQRIKDIDSRFHEKEKFLGSSYQNSLNNLQKQHKETIERTKKIIEHNENDYERAKEQKADQIVKFRENTSNELKNLDEQLTQKLTQKERDYQKVSELKDNDNRITLQKLHDENIKEIKNENSKKENELTETKRTLESQKKYYEEMLKDSSKILEKKRHEAILNGEKAITDQESDYNIRLNDQNLSQRRKLEQLRSRHRKELESLNSSYITDKTLLEVKLKNELENSKNELTGRKTELEKNYEDTIKREQFSKEYQLKNMQEKALKDLSELSELYAQEQKKMRENFRKQLDGQRLEHLDLYNHETNRFNTEINNLVKVGDNEIKRIGTDTARKVSTTQSKSDDPFYQVKDLDSNLKETDTAFHLQVTVPEYEKKHIRVTLNKNSININGQRRFQNALTDENGKITRTNGFESYTQSYPLNKRVDTRAIQEQWDGNTLYVYIPKT